MAKVRSFAQVVIVGREKEFSKASVRIVPRVLLNEMQLARMLWTNEIAKTGSLAIDSPADLPKSCSVFLVGMVKQQRAIALVTADWGKSIA